MAKVLNQRNVWTTAALEEFSSWRGQLAENIKSAIKRRTIYNAVYSELSALSERHLSDIGIARADIPRLAREQAEKDS